MLPLELVLEGDDLVLGLVLPELLDPLTLLLFLLLLVPHLDLLVEWHSPPLLVLLEDRPQVDRRTADFADFSDRSRHFLQGVADQVRRFVVHQPATDAARALVTVTVLSVDSVIGVSGPAWLKRIPGKLVQTFLALSNALQPHLLQNLEPQVGLLQLKARYVTLEIVIELLPVAVLRFLLLLLELVDEAPGFVLLLLLHMLLVLPLRPLLLYRHDLVVMDLFPGHHFAFFLPTIVFKELVQVLILVETFLDAVSIDTKLLKLFHRQRRVLLEVLFNGGLHASTRLAISNRQLRRHSPHLVDLLTSATAAWSA